MKNIFDKTASVLCAGVLSVSMMASGFTASAEEIPEPDENGVYGQAGIAWMVMDWWDYRRGTSQQAMDEYGTNEVSSTYHDVNITGNGSYTVDMSGYDCKDVSGGEYNCGYFGLFIELPLVPEEEGEEPPKMVVTLDDVTIDGVTYTFVEQPQPEDSEIMGDDEVKGGKLLKIKNGYGEPAKCEPEMDNKAWLTTDPITINFTVSGLPTDKIEGFADETVEKISGNGDISKDPPIGGEPAESAAEEEADEESAAPAEEVPDAAEEESKEEAADEKTRVQEETDDVKEEEKASSTGMFIGIGVGAVAVIAVIIAVLKKKK